MRRYSSLTPPRVARAAKQAAAVRKQIDELTLEPGGSNWRKRVSNARVLAQLLAKEARLRRLAAPLKDDGEPLPF